MIEMGIFVEGQTGLTWERLQRIAGAVEDLGLAGLYLSDHFTDAEPPDKASLELWVSLTWLASRTRRMEFGSLVTPFSFRHPAMTARMAIAVDDLSSGRFTLGVGAGWIEREHTTFGYDLLEPGARFDRFEEGLEVLSRFLRKDEPVNFRGKYYQLTDAVVLPRPQRPGGPPVLVGGTGPKRTLPLTARYADEWNAVFVNVDRFTALNRRLDELLEQEKRSPDDVRRSLMVGLILGRNKLEVKRKLKERGIPDEVLQQCGFIVGTPDQIVEQLGRLAEAGVQRVMFQWADLDDLDGLELLASNVLHQLQR